MWHGLTFCAVLVACGMMRHGIGCHGGCCCPEALLRLRGISCLRHGCVFAASAGFSVHAQLPLAVPSCQGHLMSTAASQWPLEQAAV